MQQVQPLPYRGLNTILVSRQDLITKLTANRAKHIKDYEESKAGYTIALAVFYGKMIKYYKQRKTEAEAADFDADKVDQFRALDFSTPPKPSNHRSDYDIALEKLSMSVDDRIELTDGDFNMLVMDNWAWKRDFQTTSTFYNSPSSLALKSKT